MNSFTEVCGLLGKVNTGVQLTLLALKLSGQIHFTWVQVFLPTIIPVALAGVLFLGFVLFWGRI